MPKSTKPSNLRGTLKWVSTFGFSNAQWRWWLQKIALGLQADSVTQRRIRSRSIVGGGGRSQEKIRTLWLRDVRKLPTRSTFSSPSVIIGDEIEQTNAQIWTQIYPQRAIYPPPFKCLRYVHFASTWVKLL